MKFASMLPNVWCTGFFKSAVKGLCLLALCCVPPGVCAQQKPRAASDVDLKTQLVAFLRLDPLTKAIRSVSTDGTAPSTKAGPQNHSLGSGSQAQYTALYNALKKLETTRGQYLEMLNLYVESVRNNLRPAIRSRRLNGFRNALVGLRTDLQTLKDTFGPLQLTLEYESPEVSDLVGEYISSRQANTATAGVIDTLTISELQDLSSKAAANSELIGGAVAKLLDFIKHKYPTIAMAMPRACDTATYVIVSQPLLVAGWRRLL
jgi:hypothetical protein